MVKKKILALSLAAIMILATGCSSKAAKNSSSTGTGDIVIGSLVDLSSSMAAAGQATQWGVNYAVKEINDAGGINGRKLKAVQYDIKSDVNQALTAYNRLVDQDKAVAIVGPGLSNIGIALAPIAEEKKVPIVAQFMDERATTNAKTNSPWKYIYLAEPSCTQQADDIAAYAVNELKITSVAILSDSSNSYSTSHATPFKGYMQSKGIKVVDEESYTSDAKDYKAQLTKIIATKPDAIFVPDYVQQNALAYQQARQLGYTGMILGDNTYNAPFNTLVVGTPIKNLVFAYNVDFNSSNTKFLGDAYKQANNNAIPIMNTAFGYDDVKIIANALKLAKNPNDAQEVNSLIETKTDNVLTSSGPISIDPKTHRPSNMGIFIAAWDQAGKNVQILTYYKS
jgi:branched-chain amino acid transport system substrate-binding protein